MHELRCDRLDVRGVPFPPYVSDEQQLRWNWATLIALATNWVAVQGGSAYPYPDMTFVWTETRAIYSDETLTLGSREEYESDRRRAESNGLIAPRNDSSCSPVGDDAFVDDSGITWSRVTGHDAL